MGLDPDRLYPSVYLEDDEAFGIWRDEVGTPPERIFRFGKADNFWSTGAGPAGLQRGILRPRGGIRLRQTRLHGGLRLRPLHRSLEQRFTQFYNDGHGNYTELSQKNIDTGMGLERLASSARG